MRIQFICLAVMITGMTRVKAQLLQQPYKAKLSAEKSVSATIFPVLREETGAETLVSAHYQAPFHNRFKYDVQVSTIERMYPTGVTFALRDNHTMITQALDKEVALSSRLTPSMKINVSGTIMWDNASGAKVTDAWAFSLSFTMVNKSTVTLRGESRKDDVNEAFEIKDVTIPTGEFLFNTLSVYYTGSSDKRASLYLEGTAGSHYGHERYTVRVGERWKITDRIEVQGDVEFSRVSNDYLLTGYLTRLKMCWQVNKRVTAGVLGLNNSFLELSAVIGSIQWTRERHSLRVEYRELRDDSFRSVETSHPMFCSHVMIHYRYLIRDGK